MHRRETDAPSPRCHLITSDAYTAGLIDGDGSITALRQRGSLRIDITVSGTKQATVRALQATYGGSVSRRTDGRNLAWKPIWVWRKGIARDPEWWLNTAPYLVIKRLQADTVNARTRGFNNTNRMIDSLRRSNRSLDCPHDASGVSLPYLAGLFDAEGCVSCSPNKSGHMRLYVSVTNQCRCVLDAYAGRFGGSVRAASKAFAWEVHARKAEQFLQTIEPHVIGKLRAVRLGIKLASVKSYSIHQRDKETELRIARLIYRNNKKGNPNVGNN